jgi:aryl-alcohol dehydrogenase-like predicted oxidoreductase
MAHTSNRIDRRQLLKLGTTGAAIAIGCGRRTGRLPASAVAEPMRYRQLGATGLAVSEISFGAHGVDNAQLMRAAVEAGITTFGTSGQYLDGREEEALGKALRDAGGDRSRLVVLTGNPVSDGVTVQSVVRDIDDSLRRLGTDHIDVYYAADVRSPEQVRVDAFHEAIDAAKQAGKVLHLGLSGHAGGMQEVLAAAIESGRFDVFFIKYDFVSYPDLDGLLERAATQGIGTIAFKTNAGNRQREVKDLEKGGLSYRQATLRWALSNPAVASVCVTITSFDDIRECVAAAGSRITAAEVAMLRRYAEEMRSRYCRFCSACEASCQRGVAIADVNRYWMYSQYCGRGAEAAARYAELPASRTAAACERCAAPCEAGCPFGRPVRSELVAAHRRLGTTTA